MVKLTRDLVRIPSRGGIDPYDPVLRCMAAWLAEHGLSCRRLASPGGATVALTCEVSGGRPGPRYRAGCLPGHRPVRRRGRMDLPSDIREDHGGWLHGRGSSDSKAGAAIFAHVAARLRDMAGGLGGSVVLLFDVDEHTGGLRRRESLLRGRGRPRPGRRGDDRLPGPGPRGHRGPGRAARPHPRARHRRAFRLQPPQCGRDRQGRRPDPGPAPGAAARPGRARVPAAGQAHRHRHQRRRGLLDGPGLVHLQRRHPAHPCAG